jgi:hypothetical protein
MTQSVTNLIATDTFTASLDEVIAEYSVRNPRSREMHVRAQGSLPGTNTRSGVNIDPFPIYAASGDGVYLRDLDGHELLEIPRNYREAAADDFTVHCWLFLSLLNCDIYWRNGGINALSVPTTDDHVDLATTVRTILTEGL